MPSLRSLAALATGVALALAIAGPARADCTSGAVWAWPAPNEPIDRAGRIVLDAYGTDRAWVLDVGRLSPRLSSAGHTVPLRVVESHVGSFEVAQVVLAAEQPLRPGGTYRLLLTGRPTPEVWTGQKHAPLEWSVAPAASSTPPRFRSTPRIDRTSFTPFGCGPAIYAHVVVDVDTPDRVVFRVRAEPVAGGAPVEYLVPATGGVLDIGHGMCSGPFTLASGAQYRITLSAVDTAGRETRASGGPLVVTGPAP
jgi:hypothetical protein